MSIVTSKVTDRSQTTVPPAVRTVLGLHPGERLGYVIEGNDVRLVNASALEHADPVLNKFLSFLGRDIARHPDRIGVFPPALLERAKAIASGVAVDHERAIDGAIAL
jgi:antitoxin PrlF